MTTFGEVGMDGRHRQLARVRNTASSSTCPSRRPTSRRWRPGIGSKDESFGLLPARWRSSQAPCRARGRTCRSTRGRYGTSQPVSVEKVSSRELICPSESRVDDSAMWMNGRRKHSARVPNTASSSAWPSRRSTSRRGRPEIGSRDESSDHLPAHWRSSQAPCRAGLPVR
jgi:hypothetical protein